MGLEDGAGLHPGEGITGDVGVPLARSTPVVPGRLVSAGHAEPAGANQKKNGAESAAPPGADPATGSGPGSSTTRE